MGLTQWDFIITIPSQVKRSTAIVSAGVDFDHSLVDRTHQRGPRVIGWKRIMSCSIAGIPRMGVISPN